MKVISTITLIILLIFCTFSCKKEPTPDPITDPPSSITFNSSLTYGTMTDQDGNVYKTIKIGNQTWMAENLRTTKYRNGEAIQNVTDNAQWIGLTTAAYCWYDNNAADKTTYGALYNWYAATDNRKIAPSGWRIPSNDEWLTLLNYLGGENIAGDKMKKLGLTHWESPNSGATNQSGFTALGVGERDGINGGFQYRFKICRYWSLTYFDDSNAWFNAVFNYAAYCNHSNYLPKRFGISVRCIKD